MRYLVDGNLYEVTLRIWKETRYGEDIFPDLEAHGLVNAMAEGNYDEENEAIIITREEFDALIKYYEDNEDDVISDGYEYMVDVNEI